jgi:histidyl-tRNA synthetase
MGPVWRGENTAHGRYREFWQCDFDTIGTTSNAADIETALVIHDLMLALGFERFQVRVNNRLLLSGLLEELGLADKAKPVLIAVDKLPKIGAAAVADELEKIGLDSTQKAKAIALMGTAGGLGALIEIGNSYGHNPKVADGIARLHELLKVAHAAGIPDERLRIDVSIARGLDYYTGTIYETFLGDLPGIGSVCSGGRYDNLAGLYTKQKLPGVGASLGLDRLLAAMEELNLLPKASTPAPVLVVQFSADRLGDYQKMARSLREREIGVEVFPEAKKVGQQLQYADRRGFRVALIAGPDEFAQGVWNVKDLRTQTQREKVPTADVAGVVDEMLQGRR